MRRHSLIDGFPVEAVMVAEILVLGTDYRLAQKRRQIIRPGVVRAFAFGETPQHLRRSGNRQKPKNQKKHYWRNDQQHKKQEQ